MKLYVAYKFSNIQNKQALREEIQTVSLILEGKGHSTYILGRDLQKWQDFSHPMPHKMKTIITQIKNADVVFAYVNSSVFSKGLTYELVFAKLFGKKIFLAIRNDINNKIIEGFADKVFRYSRVDDLDQIKDLS